MAILDYVTFESSFFLIFFSIWSAQIESRGGKCVAVQCDHKNDVEIENLFKCLDVENIIEIYSSLLLERKVLMISKHKALLTQVINCFLSFMFPFQWKHPLIPILPLSMVETLDAPFPYLIGIEPTPLLEELDIDDVIKVDLDKGLIFTP